MTACEKLNLNQGCGGDCKTCLIENENQEAIEMGLKNGK